MNTIKRNQVAELMGSSNGRFFTIVFTKKNGQDRIMNARLGVKRYVNGNGMNYSPASYGNKIVWDAQVQQYRTVNLETVKSLVVDRKFYTVIN